MRFRTPLYLLMIHQKETWLNANRNYNPNPKGGYESALAPDKLYIFR